MTISQGIVIGATPCEEGRGWVRDLYKSFNAKSVVEQYPITTHWTWDFELASMRVCI